MKNYNELENRILRFEKEAYTDALLEGCVINKSGKVVISDNLLMGTIQSAEMPVAEFSKAVISWNTETPQGTCVEVFVQFNVEGAWSSWFTYGCWADFNRNKGSVSGQHDETGRLSTDLVKTRNGKLSSMLRVKTVLKRDNVCTDSPALRRVIVSTYTEKLMPRKIENDSHPTIDIEVAELSQMVIPQIGHVICSPTSVTMVLNHYGEKLKPEEVALGCLDNGAEIYGNWSYNVAYAGERGYEAFVKGCNSFDEIVECLEAETPVVASINTKVAEELTGAPQAYPGGHLIVIRGLKSINGRPHIIVNDPASKDLDLIKRYYSVEEFEKVWNRIIYIIRPEI